MSFVSFASNARRIVSARMRWRASISNCVGSSSMQHPQSGFRGVCFGRQHFLYFLPLLHGQGLLRCGFSMEFFGKRWVDGVVPFGRDDAAEQGKCFCRAMQAVTGCRAGPRETGNPAVVYRAYLCAGHEGVHDLRRECRCVGVVHGISCVARGLFPRRGRLRCGCET
jgi:hypothetical protein